MRRLILIAASLAASALWPLQAVDLGLDLSTLASLSAGGPLVSIETRSSAGFDLPASLYAKLEVVQNRDLLAGSSAAFAPRLSKMTATLEYAGDILVAGGTIGLRDLQTAVSPSLGGFARATIPLVGDMLSLVASATAASDLRGVYARMGLAPTAYLPLARPVAADITAEVDLALGSWDGVSYTGPTFAKAGPELLIGLGGSSSATLSAGYVLDLADGRFSERSAGVYVGLGLSFSLSSK
jgi:hypothetical protein